MRDLLNSCFFGFKMENLLYFPLSRKKKNAVPARKNLCGMYGEGAFKLASQCQKLVR